MLEIPSQAQYLFTKGKTHQNGYFLLSINSAQYLHFHIPEIMKVEKFSVLIHQFNILKTRRAKVPYMNRKPLNPHLFLIFFL